MPDEKANISRAAGTCFECVDSGVSCVLTRFKLKSVLSLPLFYLAFLRVRRHATVSGLLKATFLVESPRVCYTLSLWAHDSAIVQFSEHAIHVATANWSLSHVYRRDLRRVELWSTQWRLYALSNNLNWDGVDLRAAIAEADLLSKSMHDGR